MKVVKCVDCGIRLRTKASPKTAATRVHEGRGLCTSCYQRARVAGKRGSFVRLTRPWIDTVDDYEALRYRGLGLDQIADRLGRPVSTLRAALTGNWRNKKEAAR